MMSKEQYLKNVKNKLLIPRKQQSEILRDLEEIFLSAAEHGETEQQVIDRLGPPEDFARDAESQLGIDRKRCKFRMILGIFSTIAIALVSLLLTVWIYSLQPSPQIIGQSDSMTSIQIISSSPLPIPLIIFLLGIAALFIALVLIIRYYRKK